MKPSTLVARLVVSSMLVAVIVLLGMSASAWATPVQVPSGHSTVPTKTPKPTATPKATATPKPIEPQLNISSVTCSDGKIEIHFVVVHVPKDVKSYGKVKYVLNGTTRYASFTKLSGDTAHYVERISPISSNTYKITSATVTITTKTKTYVISLHNPGKYTVGCKRR
ncbi:MAG: hypothetical protein IPO81_18460 [Kouleothrix sp.]|nr:hypothetical protein [Kouleothrix sp.]